MATRVGLRYIVGPADHPEGDSSFHVHAVVNRALFALRMGEAGDLPFRLASPENLAISSRTSRSLRYLGCPNSENPPSCQACGVVNPITHPPRPRSSFWPVDSTYSAFLVLSFGRST
jgi:hypothetical protein